MPRRNHPAKRRCTKKNTEKRTPEMMAQMMSEYGYFEQDELKKAKNAPMNVRH